MTEEELGFVSLKPTHDGFTALLSLDAVVTSESDAEGLARRAARMYRSSTNKMRSTLEQIRRFRDSRELIPARMVWDIGDSVLELRHELQTIGLQLDGVYEHLSRDLGVKRKWLEKAIILRRYTPHRNAIPAELNWGRLEKGTRKKALRLVRGLSVE